jgi:hypothetical protein
MLMTVALTRVLIEVTGMIARATPPMIVSRITTTAVTSDGLPSKAIAEITVMCFSLAVGAAANVDIGDITVIVNADCRGVAVGLCH